MPQRYLFNISLHVFSYLIGKREIHWAVFAVINKEWVLCDEREKYLYYTLIIFTLQQIHNIVVLNTI